MQGERVAVHRVGDPGVFAVVGDEQGEFLGRCLELAELHGTDRAFVENRTEIRRRRVQRVVLFVLPR